MLLKQYDNNPDFHGWRNKITTEFKTDSISLQLATAQGNQPLDDACIVSGGWSLKPMHDLTVSILYTHT